MKTKYTIAIGFLAVVLIISLIALNTNTTGNVVKQPTQIPQDTMNIEIKGSDTLLQLVSNNAEEFSNQNPDIKISVTGGGSGTGIAALINGEVTIADASRQIKDSEIEQAQSNGIKIYEFRIARDMLSVIVNNDNPVKDLTMEQIGAIYRGEITNWKDVGGNDETITLYGRQSTSGTYGFFRDHVLEGEYAESMRNMEGNQAILEAVAQDKTGVGYVGIGYIVDSEGTATDEVGILEVNGVSPLSENIAAYPISRALYQYTAGFPKEDSAAYKFLMFELSNEGQAIAEKTGFRKITPEDKEANDKQMIQL